MRSRPTSLRLVRVAAGIAQTEISKKTGIGLPRLGRIERGIVKATNDELRRILAALGAEAAVFEAASKLRRKSRRVDGDGPEPPEAA